MKRMIPIFLMLVLLAGLLAACGGESNEPSTSESSEEFHQAKLIADFSGGSEEPNRKEKSYPYYGQLDLEALPEQLSSWTGLDFTLNSITTTDKGIVVDWAKGSTLIAGLDDREQKEEFRFLDADSLRWFMLDSLYQTLKTNQSSGGDIFYTMDGGKELALEDLSPVSAFTLDTPYMGSAFYFAHSDVRGDEAENTGKASTDARKDESGSTSKASGDSAAESPADLGWWGEYRGDAGILRISNVDQNQQGDWHFSFTLINLEKEDEGTAVIDAEAYATASYASYQFTFSSGKTNDDDFISIAGGTVFDGKYYRVEAAAG